MPRQSPYPALPALSRRLGALAATAVAVQLVITLPNAAAKPDPDKSHKKDGDVSAAEVGVPEAPPVAPVAPEPLPPAPAPAPAPAVTPAPPAAPATSPTQSVGTASAAPVAAPAVPDDGVSATAAGGSNRD